MTPERCPGCGAKLRPDMLACPNCPMSFPEDDSPASVGNPLKQSRYYHFVFPVLFFGAIGAAIWYLGMGLMRLGMANNQIENGNALGEKVKSTGPAAPATVGAAFKAAIGAGPPVASGGAAPPPPFSTDSGSGSGSDAGTGAAAGAEAGASGGTADGAPSDDQGMVVISRVDENGAPGKGADFARPVDGVRVTAPPSKAPREWRLRGAVYDLTTLKPLAGCSVLFTDEQTNRTIKTRTDSSGRYRAIVPPLGGGEAYSVSIEKSGYSSNYLDPATEGVRTLGADNRRALARGLAATLATAPATLASESEKPVVTDFYLAPSL